MDPEKQRVFAQAVLDLTDGKRDELQKVVRTAYDLFVEPLDLPGPDVVIDPWLSGGIVAGTGTGYDALMDRLRIWAGIIGDDAVPTPSA
jgi:hypothetical protein